MNLAIAIGVYILAALVCWRLVAGAIAWHITDSTSPRPLMEEWIFGAFFGFLAALIWPIVLLVPAMWRLLSRAPLPLNDAMLTVGAERRGRERAKAQRIAELESRTRQLESELGIK